MRRLREKKEDEREDARPRPSLSKRETPGDDSLSTYILCEGCGSERRADEFVDCAVCLMKTENLALTLQLQEYKGEVQTLKEEFKKLWEEFWKLRKEASVRRKETETRPPVPPMNQEAPKIIPTKARAQKTPWKIVSARERKPTPTEETAVATSNRYAALAEETEDKSVREEAAMGKTPGKVNVGKARAAPHKLTPRVIVGDSMVRHVNKRIKMNAEGSKRSCLPGRGLKDVLQEASK